MKGLNVKKLAAVAVGGALVGSALAPIAAAITLEKSDVVNTATGQPRVNVVAGSMGAAVSDFVWAGNIASKVAQLATVETAVSGGEGESTCTDLSVDLTVGGESSYSTEASKVYDGTNYPLISLDVGDTDDTSTEFRAMLGNGQLNFLKNETRSYRYNDTTQPDIVIKETVGIEVDAAFDKDKDVKDLVAYMSDTGDFNYVLDLGDGIPACDAAGTSNCGTAFTDDSDDHVTVPLFGEDYTVQEVDLVSTPNEIKLIKGSARTNYYEGDTIAGLTGKGVYEGEEMTAKVGALIQSAGTGAYSARMELYDSAGNLVDYEEVAASTYLNEVFLKDGEYVLETIVYIETVNLEPTTSKGVVSVITGTNVVSIAHNEEFPWDSTETDSADDYWIATFDTNTTVTNPDVTTVTALTIKNKRMLWNQEDPLWSTDDSLTEAGQDAAAAGGNEAMFMQGAPEGAPGYGFVKVRYDGFKMDEDVTTVKIGNGNMVYSDSGGKQRTVPFYIELDRPTQDPSEQYFDIDEQRIYYKCSSTDVNFPIQNGQVLNGDTIDINIGGALGVDPWVTVADDNLLAIDLNNGTHSLNGFTLDRNGVEFGLEAWQPTTQQLWLLADGNCQFQDQQFSSSGAVDTGNILQVNSAAPQWSTVYYDDDNATRDPLDLPIYVTGDQLDDTYRYRMLTDKEGTTQDGKAYLLLDWTTDFSNEFSNVDFRFNGVDTGEVGDVSLDPSATRYYLPDREEFGQDDADTQYLVANFSVDVNSTNDANVYIDTATGDILQLPNTDLSAYRSDVNFANFGHKLTTDTDSSGYQASWVDYGTKMELTDDLKTASFRIPEAQIYQRLAVLGESATVVTEGGETAEAVEAGETVTLNNAEVTVSAINATAGTCTIEDATYDKAVAVGQLVYTDTPEPAGSHVIVGGYMVNKLAQTVTLGDGSTLQEALTSAGDRVAELLANGDIIVAGYTAADTEAAAKELIAELETLMA